MLNQSADGFFADSMSAIVAQGGTTENAANLFQADGTSDLFVRRFSAGRIRRHVRRRVFRSLGVGGSFSVGGSLGEVGRPLDLRTFDFPRSGRFDRWLRLPDQPLTNFAVGGTSLMS